MSDINAYCLFCEDIREETDGRHTFVGVSGGTLFIPPETNNVDRLKAVCLATIFGADKREVNITISARVKMDGKKASAPVYSALFHRDEQDVFDEWHLQLTVNLKGMPVEEGAMGEIDFDVDGFKAVARVAFTHSREIMNELAAMEPDVVVRTDGPTLKKSTRKPIAKRSKMKRKDSGE
jgi:hypothetical protein